VIDLHSHTVHSDGDRSPAQLLAEAAAAGVTVLSVTDHDTVSGIAECRAASEAVGVRLVPGIELSCDLHGLPYEILLATATRCRSPSRATRSPSLPASGGTPS